jgi:pyridoxal 5'-phosphate synthase pdxS subunit
MQFKNERGADMEKELGTIAIKRGLAQMLKGGVIMDVVTPEHAKIAEDAGARAP